MATATSSSPFTNYIKPGSNKLPSFGSTSTSTNTTTPAMAAIQNIQNGGRSASAGQSPSPLSQLGSAIWNFPGQVVKQVGAVGHMLTDPIGTVNYNTPNLQSKINPQTGLLNDFGGKGNTTETSGFDTTKPVTTTGASSSTGSSQLDTTTTGGSSGSSSVIPPANTDTQGLIYSTDPYKRSIQIQSDYAAGQGNPQVNTAQQGLQGIAQNQTPDVMNAKNQYNQFAQASPITLANVANNPNVANEVSVGRGAQLGQVLSGEQQALGQNVTNALAGQNQQISAGQNAGNMAQTQQEAQLGAAQNVAGIPGVSPQLGAYGQTYYQFGNPNATGGIGGLTGPAAKGAADSMSTMGGDYTTHNRHLATVLGTDGKSGYQQDFNNLLQSSGLNQSTLPVLNSAATFASANLSGPAAQLQNRFANIVNEYSAILGDQTVNNLLQNSQATTVSDFLDALKSQAQQKVQSEYSISQGGSPNTQSNTSSGGNSYTSQSGRSYNLPY